jgi:membrane protein YqaA with SNARE-associated domain
MKVVRRLYDWVLGWADYRYAGAGLFLLAFIESSVFPIPPDVLLIALTLSQPLSAMRYALLASFGSVLGGVLGYAIGFLLWQFLADFFFSYIPGFSPQGFARAQELFARYDFLVVFTAGFTPIPYKLITIGAGVFNLSFPVFVIASLVGRSSRFFLVAWLLKHYGSPMRAFIERYFDWLAIGVTLVLIGSFFIVRLL